MPIAAYERNHAVGGVPCGVTEESHRDAMNDAIRAQRERGAVPKSMLPPDDDRAPAAPQEPPPPEPQPAPPKKSFVARLLGR
jgi:hypothetical protein